MSEPVVISEEQAKDILPVLLEKNKKLQTDFENLQVQYFHCVNQYNDAMRKIAAAKEALS